MKAYRQCSLKIVIQSYATTNEADDSRKDNFYELLQTVIVKINANDITIEMGDLNAKIVSYNTVLVDIMGKQKIGNNKDQGISNEAMGRTLQRNVNRSPDETIADISQAEVELQLNCDRPYKAEIE